jgi:hypothetical protein
MIGITMATSIFVQMYSIMQANWLQYSLKMSLLHLPIPTMLYYRYPYLGYALSIVTSSAYFIAGHDERALMGIETFLWVVSIITLSWLLACILAWQLPIYYPVSVIK